MIRVLAQGARRQGILEILYRNKVFSFSHFPPTEDWSPLKLLFRQCPGFSRRQVYFPAKREDRPKEKTVLNIVILGICLSSPLASLRVALCPKALDSVRHAWSPWCSRRSLTILSPQASSTTPQPCHLRQAIQSP